MADHLPLRECFLERNQVPTISVMTKYMKPALANVYFKSMSPKLKVIAGLEPPLNGAGASWYVPPKDLLEGRSVMKPLNAKYLSQLGWCGLDDMAMKVLLTYRAQMKSKMARALENSDIKCKIAVEKACEQHHNVYSKKKKKVVWKRLNHAFSEFTTLYVTSMTKLEELMAQATIKMIKDTRHKAHQKMQIKFKDLLQNQAAKIMNIHTDKLEEEKAKLKTNFIEKLERRRTLFFDKLHGINLEKHIAVEKLRHFLECEKIGCQIYVAMKERQECFEKMESAKNKHNKMTEMLTKQILKKDVQIQQAEKLEKETDELIKMWQEKVCHIVKKFQMFVSYCLKLLPEQADFFINIEKLMLLQLSEVLEKPSAYSMFELDSKKMKAPQPKPHSFYLIGDKDYKPKLNQGLCPVHCTSSASQMPVIVINKQCIYAACDKFELCTDKLKDYINDDILDETSLEDTYNYDDAKPVKCASTQQLQELKLESSLLQVLEQEIANIQEVSFACPGCKIPHCCDCSQDIIPKQLEPEKVKESISTSLSEPSINLAREVELTHEREPKWESYLKYVEPKKCECSKTAKKHLLEHLPAYMRKMSYYDEPELLHYKTCSATKLKTLVEIARRGKIYIPPLPVKSPETNKDAATQYEDHDFDNLSICFCTDDDVLVRFTRQFNIVGDSQSSTFLREKTDSFVRERTRSLRRLMESAEVQEIFESKDCSKFQQ